MEKAYLKRFVFSWPLSSLALMLAVEVTAQTFTTLHSFTAGYDSFYTNNDGVQPSGGVILSGNTLFGTAYTGGSSGAGTVFKVNTDGTAFTIVHTFTGGSDGAHPHNALVVFGDTLYGTAEIGGGSGAGTVFKVTTDGSGFTNLYSFTATSGPFPSTNSDGALPYARLVLQNNTLYGAAAIGGIFGGGTLFAINTDGTGFTNLHNFLRLDRNAAGGFTNADGAFPGNLILVGNRLYGTTGNGGSTGHGTVFGINTDGTGFTNLQIFTAYCDIYPCAPTNSDGVNPSGGLISSGNRLYGTTYYGGASGVGTVFTIHIDGKGFTNLHSFIYEKDGAYPSGILILSGNTLYGTASRGGGFGNGTVFKVNTDGTDFVNLFDLTTDDGRYPSGSLVLSGSTLYGAAAQGGVGNGGALFCLSFAPQLTIIPSGANVILMWPTNYRGFDYSAYILQSTTNLVSPVWTTNAQVPVIINEQNTVTNPISGTRKFYRLSQ